MAWTAPRTWIAGETVTAVLFNTHVRDNFLAINSIPATRVFNSASLTIATGTNTAITFDSERFDTDAIHDTSTNTSRLTCKTAGIYGIGAHAEWPVNGTGTRILTIRLNGASFIAMQNQPGSAADISRQSVATLYRLAVNDYVEMVVAQTSGGNLAVNSTGFYSPEFWMHRLSD